MNAFDLSPAQIRNRLILLARRTARAAVPFPQPGEHPPARVASASAKVHPVPVNPRVSVGPGDVVLLAEADQRCATGPLRLRIVRVRADISQWYDGRWVWLEGVEIGPDGQDGALRHVLARVDAVP